MPDTLSTTEPPSEHRPWCDPVRHAEVGYCLGGATFDGHRMITRIVVEHATKTLVVIEQYPPGHDEDPDAVVAWDAAEARRVWTLMGELLDQVEAAP